MKIYLKHRIEVGQCTLPASTKSNRNQSGVVLKETFIDAEFVEK